MNSAHSINYELASILNYDVNKVSNGIMSDYGEFDIVDINTCKMLLEQADGDVTLVREIYLSFFSEAEILVKRAGAYHKKCNYKKLAEIIHSLSGISASVGAIRLRMIAKDVEYSVKQKDFERVNSLAPIMYKSYMDFKRSINQIL